MSPFYVAESDISIIFTSLIGFSFVFMGIVKAISLARDS